MLKNSHFMRKNDIIINNNFNKFILVNAMLGEIGDWGLGIVDCGLGIGDLFQLLISHFINPSSFLLLFLIS